MPVIFARWIVGTAAMLMLVVILSGVVTHKKIFRDFLSPCNAAGASDPGWTDTTPPPYWRCRSIR